MDIMYRKTVEPKTLYAFNQEGEYYLQVRDITSRNGEPRFKYRVLIRPQIPHMGKVEAQEDRINLAAGEVQRLTVVAEQEEGFTGEIGVAVRNLPSGVQSVTGIEVEPEKGPLLDEGPKERFLPKRQKTAILLEASPDASPTELPQLVRVEAQPVLQRKPGQRTLVREIPLTIVKPDEGPSKGTVER